jgi:hypothetical protein
MLATGVYMWSMEVKEMNATNMIVVASSVAVFVMSALYLWAVLL